ncbi:hypothetical protein [Bacillus sp. UNC41MFS5]|uniref:hypothetical protein n=1 Tax=Bacillus sp. UNC41MFS5 TaxID=1449046 RepID=UPI0005512B1E|nr:hypothetical protein [Bacillus sp. UNC41MFS5]
MSDSSSFSREFLYHGIVPNFETIKEEKKMKDLKKWMLVLMASFMLLGVASGCSNTKTDADTEQNQDSGNTDSPDSGSDQGTDDSGE